MKNLPLFWGQGKVQKPTFLVVLGQNSNIKIRISFSSLSLINSKSTFNNFITLNSKLPNKLIVLLIVLKEYALTYYLKFIWITFKYL